MNPFFTMKRTLPVIILALILGAGVPRPLAAPALAQDSGGYTYTMVGGKNEPQTYSDQTVGGFAFTHFTYRSLYPAGMEFKAIITPPEGVTINQVTLFYTFSTGKAGRVRAEMGSRQPNEWIATPYSGYGLPPWHELDVYWGVRAGGDISVDSAPVHAVYYDASRTWYRAESQDILIYWYGMQEDLGKYVIDAMAGNRATYLAGFGIKLPYRPMAVIFPPGPAWNEYKGDSSIDDTQLGFTGTIIPEAGSTIQRVRTLEPAEIRQNCIWNPKDPDVVFQMKQAASTTTHEVAHLYQQERGVSGPDWWVEGQATFFETFEEYPFDARLSKLAELRGGDFPTLQNGGPGGGALTAQEDGCTHMIYDMGASFMRWLVEARGGIETYRAIVDEMARSYPLEQALQTATGEAFIDLENEWRAHLGIGPVPAEELDPALALGDPVEPYFEAGSSVTLPASPFQQPIYSEPSLTSIANAACFANTPVKILRAGGDGTLNWYEVDCMGMGGWMNQGQLVGQ